MATLSERRSCRIGMRTRRSAALGDVIGDPGAFAADHQDVAVAIARQRRPKWRRLVVSRTSRRPCDSRHWREVGVALVLGELGVRRDSRGRRGCSSPRRKREAGRMDDVDVDAEAGAEPQHGAGILGNVGLIESEVDCDFELPPRKSPWRLAGGYSVAAGESHLWPRWTSSEESAKRTPKITRR